MIRYLQIVSILLNPRVRRVPLQVIKELRARGVQRLPSAVEKSMAGRVPGLKAIGFFRRWLDGERITRHRRQWVINSFLPPFPGPAYERMFQNLLSGRRLSPVSAFLAVSGECTYRCWHCSVKNRAGGRLPTAQCTRVIGELNDLGASIVGFTGGEPCLRDDLPDLVAAAARGGAATIVFSSGAAVEPRLVSQLVQAGLWALCISLDHPVAAEHDRLRGAPGSHDRACAALKLARSAGLYTLAGTVATREIARSGLLERIHELARHCGAHELRIMEPMPCGLLARDPGNSLLTPEDVARLRQFHIETNRRGTNPKVCAFNHVESPELFGCGAGTQHLFIDPAGEVCPCDFTAMSFGNVSKTPLDRIWADMTAAMGNPRRHCFIQQHHGLLLKHGNGRFPLRPEQSHAVCAEAGHEPLPDYFQVLTGKRG